MSLYSIVFDGGAVVCVRVNVCRLFCSALFCFVLAALFSFDVAGLFVCLLGFWSLSSLFSCSTLLSSPLVASPVVDGLLSLCFAPYVALFFVRLNDIRQRPR